MAKVTRSQLEQFAYSNPQRYLELYGDDDPLQLGDIIRTGLNAPAKPDKEPSDFMAGLGQTLPQTKAALGGSLAYIGDLIGKDSWKEAGLDIAQRNLEEANANARPQYDVTKIGSIGDAVDFLQYASGYVLGQAAETAALAGTGALIGGAMSGPAAPVGGVAGAVGGVVAKQAVKKAAFNWVEKQVAKRVASGMTEQAARKKLGQYIGAAAATVGNNLTQEVGAIYPEAVEQARSEGRETLNGTDLARIGASGAGAALVESWADKLNLGKLFGGWSGKVTDELADKTLSTLKGRAAREVPLGIAREAGTELVQTGMERFGAAKPLTGDDATHEYLNATAIGGVGGGMVGGAAALRGDPMDQAIQRSRIMREQKRKDADAATAAKAEADELERINAEIEQARVDGEARDEAARIQGEMQDEVNRKLGMGERAPARTIEDIVAAFVANDQQQAGVAVDPETQHEYPLTPLEEMQQRAGIYEPKVRPPVTGEVGSAPVAGSATLEGDAPIPVGDSATLSGDAPAGRPSTVAELERLGRATTDIEARKQIAAQIVAEEKRLDGERVAGEKRNAAAELRKLAGTSSPEVRERLLAMADKIDTPSAKVDPGNVEVGAESPALIELREARKRTTSPTVLKALDAEIKAQEQAILGPKVKAAKVEEKVSGARQRAADALELRELAKASGDKDAAARMNALADTLAPETGNIVGKKLNIQWTEFSPNSGTKGVARADMPQVAAEHRGALVNFIKGKGVTHVTEDVDPRTLKPTQAEFSPGKVKKAQAYEGGDRAILISSDGHIVDGHHQWMARRDAGQPIKVIRLNAPISKLLPMVRQFPSATVESGAKPAPAAKVEAKVAAPAAAPTPAAPKPTPAKSKAKTTQADALAAVQEIADNDAAAYSEATGQKVAAPKIRIVEAPRAMRALVSAVEQVFGRQIVFIDADTPLLFEGTNIGRINDVLYVYAKARKNPVRIAMHELLHSLKNENEEGYLDLRAAVLKHLDENATSTWRNRYTPKDPETGKPIPELELDQEKVWEEILADTLGDFGATKQFWQSIADRMEPGTAKQVLTKIAEYIDKLVAALKKNTDMGSKQYWTKLEPVHAALQEFLLQDGGQQGGDQSIKFSRDNIDKSITGDTREKAQPARDGSRRDRGREIAPLDGAPQIQGATGPDPAIVEVAERYAKTIGLTLKRQSRYADVDEARAIRIKDAYEAMPHAPRNLKVQRAYRELIKQTTAQYRALEAAGYRFYLFGDKNDPYAANPWNAMRDLRATKSMGVYSTEEGFGSDATRVANDENNPMEADTGIQWPWGSLDGPPRRVLANDLFRAVHDAFGHGMEGAGFREVGEENAWQAHMRLFTGEAIGALTSETRGQNSWLNFGPYGEQNKRAKVDGTEFARQKTGLMPEWTWTEGVVPDARDDVRFARGDAAEEIVEQRTEDAPQDTTAAKWQAFGKDFRKYVTDKYFRTPISDRKSLQGIADAISPGMQVGNFHKPDDKQYAKGIISVAEVTAPNGGRGFVMRMPGDTLAIDVSNFASGYSQGSALYNIVSNYAYNNGLKFIGDEMGITDFGIRRRVEAMLNTALKFGTTRHIEPHPNQMSVETDEISALDWREGDDDFNIGSLLRTAYENVQKNLPEIDSITYNEKQDRFEKDGKAFTDEQFEALAGTDGARTALAGATTLKRTALIGTKLRQSPKQRAAGKMGAALEGVAYSRPEQEPVPIFYSGLTRAVEGAKITKGPAAQWKGTLANMTGAKKEEIEWSGLMQWLDAQTGAVTKEQVVEFLRANEVRVTETVLGDGDAYRALMRKFPELEDDENWAETVVDSVSGSRQNAVETKFESYQLPGGRNYRELLLTLPSRVAPTPPELTETTDESAQRVFGRRWFDLDDEQRIAVVDDMRQRTAGLKKPDASVDYRSSHFEQPNILAHVRFNERETLSAEGQSAADRRKSRQPEIDKLTAELGDAIRQTNRERKPQYDAASKEVLADIKAGRVNLGDRDEEIMRRVQALGDTPGRIRQGEIEARIDALRKELGDAPKPQRMLFIEEVQSDWHQAGRKSGYAKPRGSTEGWSAEKTADGWWKATDPSGNVQYIKSAADAKSAIERAVVDQSASRNSGKVPDAPFKKSWGMLAMKRMIRYAAANGFDSIGWTTGEQQAERYDLSKQVDAVYVRKNKDGTYDIGALTHDEGVKEIARSASEEKLSDFIGKDLAEKAGKQKPGHEQKYEGLDLKVGGEAMSSFYDRELRNDVQKYVKQWGARVGTSRIMTDKVPQLTKYSEPLHSVVHSVEFTPEMRAAALRDQPMFSRPTNTSGAPMYAGQPDMVLGPETRLRKFERLIVNNMNRVDEAWKFLKARGGVMADDNDVAAAETLYYGKVGEGLRQLDKKFIKPLMQQVQLAESLGLDMEQIRKYIVAQHAEERNREVAKRRRDGKFQDGGSGMFNKDARDIKALYSGDKKLALDNIFGTIRAMHEDRVRTLRQAGLVDDETLRAWDVYDNYVPLKTVDEDPDFSGTGMGFDIRGKESKAALGRVSEATNPLMVSIIDAQRTVIRAQKAEVGRTLLRMAKQDVNSELFQILDQDDFRTMVYNSKTKMAQEAVDTAAMRDAFAVKQDDGSVKFIVVKDEILKAQLKKMSSAGDVGALLSTIGKGTRTLSKLYTQYNPSFTLVNAVRDAITAAINSLTYANVSSLSVLGGLPKSWAAIASVTFDRADTTWSQFYREFLEDGASSAGFGLDTIKDLSTRMNREFDITVGQQSLGQLAQARNSALRMGKTVADWVSDANGVVENAARLSLYVEARAKGYTRQQAATMAKEVTVNFNRKGEMGTAVNSAFMFFNAAVQGNRALYMHAKKSPKVRAAIFGMGALGFVMAALASSMGEDDETGDDTENKISDWEKDHSIVLFINKDGQRVKFPLPYGYNVPYVIGRRAFRLLSGKDSAAKTAVGIVGASYDAFMPMGGAVDNAPLSENILRTLTPTIAMPFFDIATNRTRYGTPIVKERMGRYGANTPNSQMHFAGVSGISKGVTDWLNEATGGNEIKAGGIDLNPEYLDYWAGFFTGGVGTTITGLSQLAGDEPSASRAPVVKAFYGGESPYYLSGRFREISETTDVLEGRLRDRDETLTPKEREIAIASKNVNLELNRLYKRRKAVSAIGGDTAILEERIKRQQKRLIAVYNRVTKGE